MSRIGRSPIPVPSNVTVTLSGVVDSTNGNGIDRDPAKLFGGGNLQDDLVSATLVYDTSLGFGTPDNIAKVLSDRVSVFVVLLCKGLVDNGNGAGRCRVLLRDAATGDDLLKPSERAAADEKNVRRIDLQEFLLRMFAAALRWNAGDRAFHDF